MRGRSVTGASPQSRPTITKATPLATHKELSDFLAEVERRAYKQALFAVRDDHLALDIVQDAMLKLTEKIRDPPAAPSCRCCSSVSCRTRSAISTGGRRCARCGRRPLSSLFGAEADEEAIRWKLWRWSDDSKFSEPPAEQMERAQVLAFIEKALEKLPARQRQAFLLRYWEELDVAEAAKVMGCSEGSVKTHCSRATHALATILKKQGIKL